MTDTTNDTTTPDTTTIAVPDRLPVPIYRQLATAVEARRAEVRV